MKGFFWGAGGKGGRNYLLTRLGMKGGVCLVSRVIFLAVGVGRGWGLKLGFRGLWVLFALSMEAGESDSRV